MENDQPISTAIAPRKKRWPLVLTVLLVIVIIISVLAYTQWQTIFSLTTGSRLVSGNGAVATLQLPQGFHSTIFYGDLASPRFIAFSPDGTLFVAERGKNSIIALPDAQHSGKATQRIVVASDLDQPTSLFFYQNALYVGEASRVSRLTIGTDFKVNSRQVIVPNLPTGGNHVTRTVLVGSDGNLYVSIGSTCNNCDESNPQRATVWRYNIDGSGGRLYARGLRNAVGMASNPWNKQIWVTNNGRDLLGDDIPPETVYALQDGGNYGWPRCHAGTIIDPDMGHTGDCNGIVQPQVRMQAHSAPLGLAFYNTGQFPPQYRGLFVAFHGSWNRTTPTGYKVIFVPMNDRGEVTGKPQDFATGWLQNNATTLGRPVGLAVGPDGALYVSDDMAGIIYRITYGG